MKQSNVELRPSKELFAIAIKIADQTIPHIRESALYNLYRDYAERLIKEDILIKVPSLCDVDNKYENQTISVPIVQMEGRSHFFSPKRGWTAIDEEKIRVYGLSFDWLLKRILYEFGSKTKHEYIPILDQFIWSIGNIQLKHLSVPIIIVRCLRNDKVYNALIEYLNSQHYKISALVVALDNYLPLYLKLKFPNILVRIQDIIAYNEKDKLLFNIELIVDNIEKHLNINGFSEGYRSACINGISYVFSKKQAAALEEMDKANKPMHQEEITAIISPDSINSKLSSLFRSRKGKHPAWNIIIKGDGKGNYWLKY